MGFTVKEIAAALGAEAVGDVDLSVTHAAEPADASPTALALAMNPDYGDTLVNGSAKVAVLWDGADWQALGLKAAVIVSRPRYAMSSLTKLLDQGPDIEPGIHPTAVIDPSAEIGKNASIGAFVVIGHLVKIGDNARIASHVSIAKGSSLGSDILLHAGVRIGPFVSIGHRFIAQANATIGGDGFSFVTPEKSSVEKVRENLGDQGNINQQSWTRIHSLGSVEIGDDVEIGSNSTLDRGTIRATRIGDGTKIDNLVQVGHNVQIGEDCLLCGLVGVAGSARIGNRVILGGQVGVSDNIFVGDDVVAGGATKIFSNAPAGRVLLGSPAMKMESQIEIQKALRRLPRLMRQFSELQKSVSKNGEKD